MMPSNPDGSGPVDLPVWKTDHGYELLPPSPGDDLRPTIFVLSARDVVDKVINGYLPFRVQDGKRSRVCTPGELLVSVSSNGLPIITDFAPEGAH